ncbi:hypothetical protein BDZ97DRAFT_1913335 [Flammula alnicola]|nr:hypothetical protein BDZ97DRAFT_1913335 [Flammula alnicola]
MSDLFNTILVSFSQLLFSSRALAIMAKRSSSKAIHTSMSGTSTSSHFDKSSSCGFQDQVVHRDELKADASHSEKHVSQLTELHGCLLSSFTASSSSGHNNAKRVHSSELDSPTLVPCNSPAMTPSPSQSFTRLPRSHEVVIYQDSVRDSSVTAGTLSANTSSFNISLVSDNSEEDDEFQLSGSLDVDALFYAPLEPPRRSSVSSSHGIGLGISGISKKDDSEPFDGLGIVSIRSSSWRSPSSDESDPMSSPFKELTQNPSPPCNNEAYDSDSDAFPFVKDYSMERLSSTFLQEALLTFTEDPFHGHALNSIPECKSWYELDDLSRQGSPVNSESLCAYETRGHPQRTSTPTASNSDGRAKRNFSSATISSELKRSLSGSVGKTTPHIQPLRMRSASWPANTPVSNGLGRGAINDLTSTSSPRGVGSRRIWRI